MFKKIVSGILATGILFSGSQAFAAKIEDFKLNTDNKPGNFETEDEAIKGHYYTFTATSDKKLKVNFKDISADGDVFKITVRNKSDSSKIVFSETADLNGFSLPVKKGNSYEIRVGVSTYKDGGKYDLKIYG